MHLIKQGLLESEEKKTVPTEILNPYGSSLVYTSSNPGSTHFRSRTEFQSTDGCGLSQPGLQSGLGAFTLEANPG